MSWRLARAGTFAIAAGLLHGASGCGTTKVLVPPRGPDASTGVVYFIRKSYPPYLWGCDLAIDDRRVASIADDDFVAVDVGAGRHHVMVTVTQGPEFPFDLEVAPDETHYVLLTGAVVPGHDETSAGPGSYVLEWRRRAHALSAAEGRALVTELHRRGSQAASPPPPERGDSGEPHVSLSESPAEIALSANALGVGRPRWSMGLELGMAGGGEELVAATLSDGTVERLNAGTGVTAYVHAAKALNLSARHVLYAGLAAGIKGWNIGGEGTDYDVQLIRFPVIPFIRYGYGQRPGLQPFFAAGAHIELAPHVSGSGAAAELQHDFKTAYGWMAEAGLLVASRGDVTLGVRYTHLTYESLGISGSIDASSVGVTLGLQWTSLERVPAR